MNNAGQTYLCKEVTPQEVSGMVNTWRNGDSSRPGEGIQALTLHSYLSLLISLFHLDTDSLSLVFSVINQ